jgi:hypothetical protein
MARITGRNSTMVHHKCSKGNRADMAQVAVIPGNWNMEVSVINCSFDIIGTVMTRPADTRDSAVMITSPQPSDGIKVTSIAIGSCGTMGQALAGSNSYTIVASITHT